MLPIAILPAVDYYLAGGALSNPNTVKTYPVLDVAILQNIFTLMSSAGNIVFQNLPSYFCDWCCYRPFCSDKGTAGLAALIGFLIMNATMNGMLVITDGLAKTTEFAKHGQSMC